MKIYPGATIIEHDGDRLPKVGDIYDGSAIFCRHQLGERLHISAGVKIVGQGTLITGENVTISPNVVIYTSVPKLDKRVIGNKYSDGLELLVGVVILGNNTFIGAGAVIGYDVKVGDNIVVGALSYVSKDLTIPGLYTGTPAKLVKRW